MAAIRTGDTLVVPQLDRLTRSVPDARAFADELQQRDARLQPGTTVYHPTTRSAERAASTIAYCGLTQKTTSRGLPNDQSPPNRRIGRFALTRFLVIGPGVSSSGAF